MAQQHTVQPLDGDEWLEHVYEIDGERYFDPRPMLRQEAQRRAADSGRVILVHSGAVWNSAGGGQRPQQLAETFSDDACVVHFNWHNTDLLQPTYEGPLVAALDEADEWQEWLNIEATHKVFYTSYPDPALDHMLDFIPSDWFVWYDCVDDWGNFVSNDWYRKAVEERLIARSDLVTCTAHRLREHVERLAGRRPPPIEVVYNSTRLLDQPVPEGERDVDCVFVGWMNDNWLDWGMLREVARNHSLLMVGPEPDSGRPFDGPSVEWTGQVPNTELRAVLSRARVGLAPFRPLELSQSVFPIKYCDYLAAGCTTVAAHLPELVGKPYVSVAWDVHGFVAEVDAHLTTDVDREDIMGHAESYTAEASVEQIKPLLGGAF